MRITIIDGFRGFFLIFMMIVHSNALLNVTLGKLNHHYLGWVEDAQGFVFLSGLVVGLVYTGRMRRKGYAAMRNSIWKRIGTIYSHQAGLIFIFLAVALLLSGSIAPAVLQSYQSAPVGFTLGSLLLITGSLHMGILPMYIFFMMATPLVLRLLDRNQFATVISISVCLWLFAQTGLLDQLKDATAAWLAAMNCPMKLGIFFDPFGWQIIFFGGLIIGYLMATNRLKTDFLYSPDMEKAFFVALVAIIGLAFYDRIVFDNWISVAFRNDVLARADRGNFSALYLIAFALDLFAVFWLLGPGLQSPRKVVAWAARMMQKLFTFPPLVFLGQHSLHVFSAHILCVYLLAIVLNGTRPPPLVGNLLLLFSPIPLYLAAWGHARLTRAKDKTAPSPEAKAIG